MFENLKQDWEVYERDIWRQGLWVMIAYRFGRWRYTVNARFLIHLQTSENHIANSYRHRPAL